MKRSIRAVTTGSGTRAELEHGLSPRAAVAKALACQGFVEMSATADSSSGELNR